jgi:hypothetical protein
MMCESNARINNKAAIFTQAIIQKVLTNSAFTVAVMLIAEYMVRPSAKAVE